MNSKSANPLAKTANPLAVAEAVREACRTAVAEAWEDAGVQGLCAEGRCEVAIGALERIDLAAIVERATAAASGTAAES